MANRNLVQRHTGEIGSQATATNFADTDRHFGGEVATNVSPANDNPDRDAFAACLPVTDAEVRLLHQYLGQEILGLFS
jgi:hypothetical protein